MTHFTTLNSDDDDENKGDDEPKHSPFGPSGDTEFVKWGNGGDPPIAGYRRSLIPGWLTAQQLAAPMGVTQGTARDLISGRRTGIPIGKFIGNTWFVSEEDLVRILIKRYGLGHLFL